MRKQAFSYWLSSFQQQAFALSERRLVVLVGDDEWAASLLEYSGVLTCKDLSSPRCFVYGDSSFIKPTIAMKRFRDKLGSESDFVIFADSQVNIDALAALSGTLVAGGLLFLVIPDNNVIEKSNFLQRFFRLISETCSHIVIEKNNPKLKQEKNKEIIKSTTEQNVFLPYQCITQEQVLAVEAIMKVVTGKRKQPFVLTADRGRGKSSALAIACAQLLEKAGKDNLLHIVVTAADYNSLDVFFNQLSVSLPTADFINNQFVSKYGLVEFIAVDQLIKQEIKASLVLIDEAAGIPVYLLEQLVLKYHRMVFASTVHGYEGAGRGFTLKFKQKLDVICPKWRQLHMHQPIRYRDNDPLEHLIFDACLLNADLKHLSLTSMNNAKLTLDSLMFQCIDAKTLVENEQLLAQVVSVLVTAHYQTKPSDVKMLLDNPNIQVVCLLSNDNVQVQVVAVALLISEGKSNTSSATAVEVLAIKKSQKRLKNHFTPQSLLTQCGEGRAFDFHYLRIMRIAVNVQYQQQGVGSLLLSNIERFSQTQGADFLSSSFGATSSLLKFWLTQHYQLARIGFSKDKASGEHSALILKAISARATSVANTLNNEFYRSFNFLLTDEYQNLPPELVALILYARSDSLLVDLTSYDIDSVKAFAQGHRQYACCVFSLQLWLIKKLTQADYSTQKNIGLLIARILQKQSIKKVCLEYSLTGKKALELNMRNQVNLLWVCE
ncbi:MAG: GNAT family N-acetyltransferase [Litorilituus sp.]|nr:GNAT family N-acetyltransferase [Litorilituus sp.]